MSVARGVKEWGGSPALSISEAGANAASPLAVSPPPTRLLARGRPHEGLPQQQRLNAGVAAVPAAMHGMTGVAMSARGGADEAPGETSAGTAGGAVGATVAVANRLSAQPAAPSAAAPAAASTKLAPPLRLLGVPLEPLLLLLLSALGGFAGTLLRVAASYVRPQRGWELYPGMYLYPNLAGCLLIGLVAPCKAAWTGGGLAPRLAYHFIASALCGSLTTFSGWLAEVSKLLVLQADASAGNAFSTYQGARLIDYFTQHWITFSGCYLALIAGVHASEALAASAGCWPAACARAAQRAGGWAATPRGEAAVAAVVVVVVAAATAAVVIAPAAAGWPALTWAALLGGAGAYSRFLLSLALNARVRHFPLGTFVANVAGTWLYSAVGALARFVVHYDDTAAMSLLFGIDIGFCGCLTTVSTWVVELRSLPRRAALIYGLASVALATLGPALFVEAYSGVIAASATSTLAVPPLNVCAAYTTLCASLLARVGCPAAAAVQASCPAGGGGGPGAFAGRCACGALDVTGHLAELLVDSQVKANITASLVAVWPTRLADAASDPSSVIDACLTYDNLCDHWLHRAGCPPADRALNSCARAGLRAYTGVCTCGALAVGSTRVAELLIDYLVGRREDLVPYSGGGGNATAAAAPRVINFCAAYEDVCARMLDHVQCPLAERAITGCTDGATPDYSTWVGACSCYGPAAYAPASRRIGETLLDALVRPRLFDLVYLSANASAPPGSVDACATYEAACAYFLDAIGCPAAYRSGNGGCAGPTCLAGNCTADSWRGVCACAPASAPAGAGLLLASQHIAETVVVDTALQADLLPLAYFPPSTAPYSLIAASNPFRPLLAFQYPLPTQ